MIALRKNPESFSDANLESSFFELKKDKNRYFKIKNSLLSQSKKNTMELKKCLSPKEMSLGINLCNSTDNGVKHVSMVRHPSRSTLGGGTFKELKFDESFNIKI